MGVSYKSPFNIPTLMSMEEKIGQGSFENPSVFSFFEPEFAPPGGVQSAGLVAPEAMVLQGDNILTLLDAFYSTVKFGIVDCHSMSSFESWRNNLPLTCPSNEGDYSFSPATISYSRSSPISADEIIDDLDVLFTSGRLTNSINRMHIKLLVESILATGDVSKAVRAAQELILSTPEYHITNIPRKLNEARVITGYESKPKAPYKAVVVLYLGGGVDSWNLLVPMDGCSSGA